MTPPDLSLQLRAHAALLRELRNECLAVLRPDVHEVLSLIADDLERQADRHEDARGAEAEARRVLSFRRSPVALASGSPAHEFGDLPGGAA